MPSIRKACTALFGTVAAAHALPGPTYLNSSSPLSSEQSRQACSSSACSSSHGRETSRPLASPTLVPAQGRNQTGFTGVHVNGSASDRHPWASSLHSTPVVSSTPTSRSRSSPGSSSRAGRASQSPTSSIPHTTLLPDVHWTHDKQSPENVKPILAGEPSEMFYGNSDPAKAGAFAFLHLYLTKHSVNLDLFDQVSVSSPDADSLVVKFHSREAFALARDTWAPQKGLILIAYAKGCGDYDKGERCYFDASSLEVHASSSTIVARGKARHPDDITSGEDTKWGWWSPHNGRQPHGETGAGPDASWNAGPTPAPGSGSGSGSDARSGGANQPSGRPRCVAPPDAKHGLPTACLGEHFDKDLDEGLGYVPLSDNDRAFLNKVAPELGLRAASRSADRGFNGTATSWRRHQRDLVVKRSFWSEAFETVKSFLTDVSKAIAEVIQFGGGYERELAWSLPDTGKECSADNELVADDAHEVVSPWGGKAILLKSFGSPEADGGLTKYLNVYCVDCGTKGKATIAGKASWSLLHGITEGRLEVDADMQFGLKLGVDAQISYKSDFSTELLRVGMPGLTYGCVTVAMQVSLGARVDLEVAAKGRLLAGAEMGVQASRVVVDFVDSSKNERSSWEPYFKPVLEVEGATSLAASLALPVGLECGLAISKWHKTVSLTDEPSIKAVSQAAAAISLRGDGALSSGFKERDGCTGLSSQITWRNRLFINMVDVKEHRLFDTGERGLARDCIALPAYEKVSNETAAAVKRSRMPVVDLTSKYAAHGSRFVTSTPAPLEVSSYSEATGLSYARIVTPDGGAMVVSCSNGNLYVVRADGERNADCSELFPMGRDGTIASDGARRLLHYDPAAMSELGAARLRLRADEEVTRSAITVALGLYADASAANMPYYVGADANGKVLYLIVCDYADGRGSKVFLASDPREGLGALESKDVTYSVTGGAVDRCQPLLVKGAGSERRRAR